MNRVLLVDDDRSYVTEMGQFLRQEGYEVETCFEPTEAISILDRRPFRCVLLDYRMPRLDGEDLLHLIRKKYPEIPVIICSGYLDARESYLLREGAYDILLKPLDPHILFDTLKRALSAEEETTPIVIEGYDLRVAREQVSRKLIIKALSKSEFNVTHAAKLLGVSRQCLLRYLKRFQIA